MTAFAGWALIIGVGWIVLAGILAVVDRAERRASRRADRVRAMLYAQRLEQRDEDEYRQAIRREIGLPLHDITSDGGI